MQTINEVDLEDYVRGVIPAEMPSSWPTQALEAQAVAARTYATAVGAASPTFDVYSDTRSQVYGGVSAQTPSGDAAEAATRGEVVDYAGQPATDLFLLELRRLHGERPERIPRAGPRGLADRRSRPL